MKIVQKFRNRIFLALKNNKISHLISFVYIVDRSRHQLLIPLN